MDRRLHKLSVINGADAGNKAEFKCNTGGGSGNGFSGSGRGRCGFAGDDLAKTILAINASFHRADTLIAERAAAANTESDVLRFRVIRAIHEISMSCSIRDSISVTRGDRYAARTAW